METLKSHSITPLLGVRASQAAPIIIATDRRSQSDGALAMGRLLADGPESIRLVTVLKTLPMVSDAQLAVSADLEAARRADSRREALAQVVRLGVAPLEVELGDGDPAMTVARVAHESGATLIVCGLGRHRVSDRVFGDETALRLVRTSDVPVLAVTERTREAPRRIVVAADFSETSVRAARMALSLAAEHATIYLAHVAPRDSALHDWKGFGDSYKIDAGDALQRMRQDLRIPRDLVVQNVLLQGDPATELLAFAASVSADLVATGSHGRGFAARMLIGSVATRIVRCSTCSVLTIPHAAAMTDLIVTAEPAMVRTLPHADWAYEMDDFSRRNFGRRSSLEVDDPDVGAQAQCFDYPMLGVTFDVHDERLEMMFGDVQRRGRHITRGIDGVLSIDVLRDDKGRDLAIRVAHGAGQTLLTFSS